MITQSRLKELVNYDPLTGIFTWRCNRGGTAWKGSIAGHKHSSGRVYLNLDREKYFAHTMAWLYMYGEVIPNLDHRDTNGLNNRIKNLRKATQSQNMRNSRIRSDNSSGIKGVSWSKSRKRWIVRLNTEPHLVKHIGSFKDIELAELVANEARKLYHGEFGRTG